MSKRFHRKQTQIFPSETRKTLSESNFDNIQEVPTFHKWSKAVRRCHAMVLRC